MGFHVTGDSNRQEPPRAHCLVVAVPTHLGEFERKRLQDAGLIRLDFHPEVEAGIFFIPVLASPGAKLRLMRPREMRPKQYWEELPEALQPLAPRAFDQLNTIVILKIPSEIWEHRNEVGAALLSFVRGCEGVFHDHGITGEFRVRNLECIAGNDSTETRIRENGLELIIDPRRAYYSSRLAHDRQEQLRMVRSGDDVLDLFGGVGPWAVLAAKIGAHVYSNDLNPDACEIANRNSVLNNVELGVTNMDARQLIKEMANRNETFAHVAMNLPHGALHFLEAARLVRTGGYLHYHAIEERNKWQEHLNFVLFEINKYGKFGIIEDRIVRPYAATMDHRRLTIRRNK